MTIMYTNADSLLNKRDELTIRIRCNPPEIIAITETLPKHEVEINPEVEFHIPGYDLILSKQSSRGVAVYIKESIPHRPHELTDTVYSDHVWMLIEPRQQEKVLLGCVYRSPNSSETNNEKLNDIINQAGKVTGTHLIIVGDFNYKEIDWNREVAACNESHPATKFLDTVTGNFLTQHVDEPTRFREGQTPNMLDLVISNNEQLVQNIVSSAPLGKSDHVVLEVHLSIASQSTVTPEKLNFYKGNYEEMIKELQEVNWTDELEGKTVDEAWNTLASKLTVTMEKHIPKSGKRKPQRKIWMSKATDAAVQEKHKTWNRYQKSKSADDHEIAKQAGYESTRITRQAKADFEKLIVDGIKKNPKSFWSYVAYKTSIRSGIGDLQNAEGEIVTSDQDKTELLNAFFTSVFTVEDLTNIPEIPQQTDNIITNMDVTPEKIMKVLDMVDETKSPGPDQIHAKVIKELKDQLVEPLTTIFKSSLEESQLPQQWKQANVIPIFKKGKKTEPGNYRPVSLTVIACKLMEKLIRDEVVDHMTKHKLFTDAQYGFRSGRSCALQLLEVLEEWTELIDEGIPIDCVYLDYKKAFDSVPHVRLMKKVHAFGIQGKLENWIRSFLSNRQQRVVVNGKESEWLSVVVERFDGKSICRRF